MPRRSDRQVIDEHGLDQFRAEQLAPANLLRLIELYVWVLFRLPVGVGKTHAAQLLLKFRELYERFDLVIYSAPAWAIVRAVLAAIDPNSSWPTRRVLEARPRERCGELDEEWSDLESRGCSVLAKVQLCQRRCPVSNDCKWPNQLRDLGGISLVVTTDQRIELVPNILWIIRERSGCHRPLLLLDEAGLLDTEVTVCISYKDLIQTIGAIRHAKCRKLGWPSLRERWLGEVGRLLDASQATLQGTKWEFSEDLHSFGFQVQAAGNARDGQAFRYVGYDLSLLATSRPEERWRDTDGIRFIGRPYFRCHVALLSASLTPEYVGHRLGAGPVASPFDRYEFLHSETRIFNVRNTGGAARYSKTHHERNLDTFAVLIVRNVCQGRSTVLVSKKDRKRSVATYLTRRLAAWGLNVSFVTEDYGSLPKRPSLIVIPILHYGIRGVNDFTEYESAFCVNSYYTRADVLNARVQEFEARHFRVELEIVHGPDRVRRAQLVDPKVSDEDRSWLAGIYLRKLEVDPVIQAAGRVRFMTKRREVVFYQTNDLGREIGACRDVSSLRALREALGVPSARDIDQAMDGRKARALMDGGLTADQAAAKMGLSRPTLFRRLEAAESLKFCMEYSHTEIETPPPSAGPSAGAA